MSRQRRLLRRGARQARRRRAPEEARQLLLDAAERVFAKAPPDEVGLKDIAREAGVSHALITHYFGTYLGLVEAALERRLATLRERIRERLQEAGAVSRPEELLAILFRTLDDPVHVRLLTWLAAGEHRSAMYAFALQQRGLSTIAQQVAAAMRPEPTPEQIRTIELALVTAVAAAVGYAVGKAGLAGAIGRAPSAQLDDDIRHTLAAMLQRYLRDAITS